ncbi:MAG TPA: PstS family phosphate ABC transporter substrate-binding protein [Burkholderiaceae bacterium]
MSARGLLVGGTLAALAALVVAGVASSVRNQGGSTLHKSVRFDGSSTVFPVTEAVAEDFQTAKRGKVRVTVGISGTGGGFKKFCRGEIDISNASRPILAKEIAACKAAGIEYIEIPVAFDALTVVVNPRNDFIRQITVAELRKIWAPEAQGKLTSWKQVNPRWPDEPLKLYGPGADSGTFDYFTEAVVGKAKSSRGDFTASEDDNVLVQGVSRDLGGLGYFGFAYYTENSDKLRAVPVVNSKGVAVGPSMDTVISGAYEPLARPIFIYVNASSILRPEVREIVEFYLNNASVLAREVGYVPLPDNAYRLALANVANNKKGTVFGGHSEVGVTVEELLTREAKN